MKVKAIDIARKLNISKASVSLALNGKPGVSEQTREAVLMCMEELKNGGDGSGIGENGSRNGGDGSRIGGGEGRNGSRIGREPQGTGSDEAALSRSGMGLMIKIVMVSKGLNIIRESELDLWTDVLRVFDREARKDGYTIGITYVDMPGDDISSVVDECNSPLIAGVILYATEMDEADFERFQSVRKPMIIYDNDFSDQFHCVNIDNVSASAMAVDYLADRGCRRIQYLSQYSDIYNFRQRRAGFRAGLRRHGMAADQESMVRIGTTIDTVEANMKDYLKHHGLPDAFVMENYQISIGVLNALRSMQIPVPGSVSLIGIDELPSYVTGDCRLATVRISHVERATAVMMILRREMKEAFPVKFKILSRCSLLPGDSVK